MTVGGVPIGGLSPSEASQRLLEVYTSPVEIQYSDATIHVDPAVVGFQPDVDSMLAAADLTRTGRPFWGGFWDYIWNRTPASASIPLRATLSEDRLREYLTDEIAARYDLPPSAAQPVPGGTTFTPGEPAQALDVDRATILLGDALRSPSTRSVALTSVRGASIRPTMPELEILLKQLVTVSDFDGLIGLYMVDLQTGQEIHFAMNAKQEIAAEPDIAFTASSTIKIPIVLSYFINRGTEIDAQTSTDLSRVLGQSDNTATDRVLERIEPNVGPLVVTRDIETLGLDSTFILGFFFPGAPKLGPDRETPGNQRADVFTDPDSYSQTTPAEMGILLSDLYQCAQTGGGGLVAAFPGKLDAEACQLVIDLMAQDKLGSLIQGGVPDGTLVPHKHGYVPDLDNIVHDISDVGIVYSPGGNFALAIYTYHPIQNIWDVTNPLFIRLTQATYNYFNLAAQ